jgi:aspartyl-tRNA(Asn)/glutamyl-tRNA(Gln) amidotransferase subunit A
MGPLAVGNDGGGSIRIPSSCCGVYGLKPQFGRIPSWPRHDGWSPLIHEGPIARTVRDAAALLDLLAGPDGRDRASLTLPKAQYLQACDGDIRGLRVAWSADLGYERLDPRVRAICEKAVKAFEEMGCSVEEAHPGIPCPDRIFQVILFSRMVAWLERELPEDFRDKIDPMLAAFIPLMNGFTTRDVIRALFDAEALRDRMDAFFSRYDVLLTPVLPTPPYELGVGGPRRVAGEKVPPLLPFCYTLPFNLTGQPAASVPAGFTEDGLPVGLQIVGRACDEPTVLRASACFEEARPWAHQWPEL